MDVTYLTRDEVNAATAADLAAAGVALTIGDARGPDEVVVADRLAGAGPRFPAAGVHDRTGGLGRPGRWSPAR